MKRLMIILIMLFVLATAGCATTSWKDGEASMVAFLMGTSKEEAKEHLETLSRIKQCYDSYTISISGYGTRTVSVQYDCPVRTYYVPVDPF